jgi:ureidoglycolate lyase
VLDGPAAFAVLMWRDGSPGDEEFVPVTTPLTIDLPQEP